MLHVSTRPEHPVPRTPGTPGAVPPPTPRRRHPRSPAGRVETKTIAAALDEIIETCALDQPYPLYRYIADEIGVHATTVLRYHSGYLASAPAPVQGFVGRLLAEVRAGRSLPFDAPAGRGTLASRRTLSDRVPATRVREGMDDVLRSLGQGENQFLCRYLAGRVGMHSTSVLRYYRGDLKSAPRSLLVELDALREKIAKGETIPFRRCPGGTPVVAREQTQLILEELARETSDEDEAALYRQIEERLAIPRGTVGRIRTDPTLRFVRADVHRALERFVQGTEYDPCGTYEVGQRVRHHLFGPGTVEAKVHKNRIRVVFGKDERVLLSEAVSEDPYRYLRSAGGGMFSGRGR